MSEPPPLWLFLDRSTQGKRFVGAVRSLVEDVVTINDMYGGKPAESVADVQWIADASASGRILIGADRYILRNPLERRTICRNAARYVVFGTNNTPVRLLIEMFERDLPRIRQLTSTPGPWVYRIARHGMERLALNCADCM
ncbi:MAG TPA: hypothetical protein VFZ32_08015 [Micromonosporaceae bacterium]